METQVRRLSICEDCKLNFFQSQYRLLHPPLGTHPLSLLSPQDHRHSPLHLHLHLFLHQPVHSLLHLLRPLHLLHVLLPTLHRQALPLPVLTQLWCLLLIRVLPQCHTLIRSRSPAPETMAPVRVWSMKWMYHPTTIWRLLERCERGKSAQSCYPQILMSVQVVGRV